MQCYFAQSTTFLHMVIWMDIVSKDIKYVLYVNLIFVFTTLSLEKNTVYLVHQKFLKPNHSYRRLQKAFNIEHKFKIAPKTLTGDEVYQK